MDSLNFQFFEQGLSQKETKKPNCAICGDVGDGHHFGLDACRLVSNNGVIQVISEN